MSLRSSWGETEVWTSLFGSLACTHGADPRLTSRVSDRDPLTQPGIFHLVTA